MKIFKNDFGYENEQDLIDDISEASEKVSEWRTSIGIPAPLFKTPIKEIIETDEYEYIDMSKEEYELSLLTDEELEEKAIKDLEEEKAKTNQTIIDNLVMIDLKSIRAIRDNDIEYLEKYRLEAANERAKLI